MHASRTTEVRRAEPGDVAAIAALSGQLGYPATADEVGRRFDAIARDPQAAVFVSVRDGTVVGWLHVATSALIEVEPRAQVGGLVVARECRGSGVGPLLLGAAEGWAREQGLGVVRVPCNIKRDDAHRFYRREGFSEIKVQRIFERPVGSAG